MSKRRGNGEGSVYRDRKGRWVACTTTGYDANGRRRRRYVYGRTKSETLSKLAKVQADSLNGQLAEPSRLCVAEYLERWLDESARARVRETTLASYQSVIRNHVNPHIGGVPLAKLNPAQIQALYAVLERAGASPRMRQLVHAILRRALHVAVRLGVIARNPFDLVDRPTAPRKEMTALDAAQVRRLVAAARGDPLEALYLTALGTGARFGELLGLWREDIDLERGGLSIRRTLVDIKGEVKIHPPKTERGRRRIDLPAFVVEALRCHLASRPATPHPKAWVFADSKGGPLRKCNVLRRSFRPLLARARLPLIRFHDLRHTAASLLLVEGVHPKVVQERLGHSTIATTLDTYSHVIPSLQREAAERLDRTIREAG